MEQKNLIHSENHAPWLSFTTSFFNVQMLETDRGKFMNFAMISESELLFLTFLRDLDRKEG